MNEIPHVQVGPVGTNPPDWRKEPEVPDPDDEDLDVTPSEIVAVLGFDPKQPA